MEKFLASLGTDGTFLFLAFAVYVLIGAWVIQLSASSKGAGSKRPFNRFGGREFGWRWGAPVKTPIPIRIDQKNPYQTESYLHDSQRRLRVLRKEDPMDQL